MVRIMGCSSMWALSEGAGSKPPECARQRVNPNVNDGLQLIIMYQWWLSCDKCPTVIPDINNGENYACGRGYIWELSALSGKFSCKLELF